MIELHLRNRNWEWRMIPGKLRLCVVWGYAFHLIVGKRVLLRR